MLCLLVVLGGGVTETSIRFIYTPQDTTSCLLFIFLKKHEGAWLTVWVSDSFLSPFDELTFKDPVCTGTRFYCINKVLHQHLLLNVNRLRLSNRTSPASARSLRHTEPQAIREASSSAPGVISSSHEMLCLLPAETDVVWGEHCFYLLLLKKNLIWFIDDLRTVKCLIHSYSDFLCHHTEHEKPCVPLSYCPAGPDIFLSCLQVRLYGISHFISREEMMRWRQNWLHDHIHQRNVV